MKVTIENKKGLNKDLKVFIDKKTMNTYMDEKFEEIKNTVNLKGFRPGKVPKELLKRQLILKNIVSMKQWEEMKDVIHFIFDQDSNFNALKNLELLTEKMNVLRDAEEYRGKYFSDEEKIRKNMVEIF